MNRTLVIVLCGLLGTLAVAVAVLPAQIPAGAPPETRKSQALLGVAPDSGQSPLAPQGPRATPEEIERMKTAMLAVAKTDAVLLTALDDPHVKSTKWYRDNVANALSVLKDSLTASSIPNTNLLSFSMTGADRNELPEIINVWADAFVKDVTESVNNDRRMQIATITDQQNRLKQEQADVERELKTLPDTDERIILQKLALRMQELQSLTGEQMKVQVAVEKARREKKMIDDMEAAGHLENHPLVRVPQDDPILRDLRVELIHLRIYDEAQAVEGGPQTRPAQDPNRRLVALEREIAARETRFRKEASEKLKYDAARQFAVASEEAVAVQARMEDLQRTVKVLSDTLKTVTELGAKRRALEANIDLLERRLLELRLLQIGERPVYIRRVASVAQ